MPSCSKVCARKAHSTLQVESMFKTTLRDYDLKNSAQCAQAHAGRQDAPLDKATIVGLLPVLMLLYCVHSELLSYYSSKAKDVP
eukprot:210593-Amphidinium_carterae.1